VTRFKANRIASAYDASTRANSSTSSTSIEESVLPESSARTIQRSIRSGRIDDNGRLVGGDHDSDSEIEAEGLQETLELLKGEVYNLGPTGKYLSTTPQPQFDAAITTSATEEDSWARTSAALSSDPVAQQQGLRHGSLPPLNRLKTSKFKADRSRSGRPSATSSSEIHTPPIPVSQAPRSSPKLPSTPPDRITEKTRGEPQAANSPEAPQPPHISPPPSSNSSSRMIVDSSSFKAPEIGQSQASSSMQPFTSMIIESPSFPNPSTGETVQEPGTTAMAFPLSTIVESPSFPPTGKRSRRPDHPPAVVSSQDPPRGSATRVPSTVSHTEPTVLSKTVLERTPPVSRDNTGGNDLSTTSNKMSRFRSTQL
jgi:hypothetical protein